MPDKRLAESIERLRIWADQYKVRPLGEKVPMIVVMAPHASDVAALLSAYKAREASVEAAEALRDAATSAHAELGRFTDGDQPAMDVWVELNDALAAFDAAKENSDA